MGSGSSHHHNAAGLKRRLSTLVCGSSTTAQKEDSVSSSSEGNESTHRVAECGCLYEISSSTHEIIASSSGESSSIRGADNPVNHDHPESSVGSAPSVIHENMAGIRGNSDADSNNLDASGSGNDTHTLEARRRRRRTMWDAFTRRGSRRQTDVQTSNTLPADDVDTIESRWSWLIEFGDDGRRSRRSLFGGDRRRHSRSPLWERLLDGGGVRGGRTACRSGLHPDGQCLCGLQGGTSGRTRMSRIVVLADVLFEVLDELQRQPTPLDQPIISNPAPKSAIDSLPIKFYKKPAAVENGDGAEKCYICLEEYKTGDEIRVLPCAHGYHPTCVDKWLKEIHGICPLCRGDVRTVPVDHV